VADLTGVERSCYDRTVLAVRRSVGQLAAWRVKQAQIADSRLAAAATDRSTIFDMITVD